MTTSRVSNALLVQTYQQLGSVWKTGRALGVSGQQVHARLQQMGHKTEGGGRAWTADEELELAELVLSKLPFLEIANRLHRSYDSVAVRASRLGLKTEKRWVRKIPRGQGLDKKAMTAHWKALESGSLTLTKYVKSVNLPIENFVRALEKYFPGEWEVYKRAHYADIPVRQCPYCEREFHPSSSRQQWCTRSCGTRHKTDEQYFGGRRRETLGLVEGICQLCGGSPEKGLSSHHVLGKENDPDNEHLVALCRGCHDVVTRLASRSWVQVTAKLENLLIWVWIRANGARLARDPKEVWAAVDIWEEEPIDLESEII